MVKSSVPWSRPILGDGYQSMFMDVCVPIIKNPITGWRSYPIFITCLGSQSLDCLQLFKHEYGDLHNTWVQWEFQDPLYMVGTSNLGS